MRQNAPKCSAKIIIIICIWLRSISRQKRTNRGSRKIAVYQSMPNLCQTNSRNWIHDITCHQDGWMDGYHLNVNNVMTSLTAGNKDFANRIKFDCCQNDC